MNKYLKKAIIIKLVCTCLSCIISCREIYTQCDDLPDCSCDSSDNDTGNRNIVITGNGSFWLMAGQQYACVGTSDVPGGKCWGNEEQISNIPSIELIQAKGIYMFSAGIASTGEIVYWGMNDEKQSLKAGPAGQKFVNMDLGNQHICAVDDNGNAWCWGYNTYGETSPPDYDDFIQVAVGDDDSCGLRSTGEIICWGRMGQEEISFPTNDYIQISSGHSHFCALTTYGEIECLGYDNDFGEVDPPPGEDFRLIASGGAHSCAIRNDNTITCWGFDTYGGSTPPDRKFATVSVGQWSACGLDLLGGIYCWGLSVGNVPEELRYDAYHEYVSSFVEE